LPELRPLFKTNSIYVRALKDDGLAELVEGDVRVDVVEGVLGPRKFHLKKFSKLYFLKQWKAA
jgi:hypothetical protein